jgi:hypothetical protein
MRSTALALLLACLVAAPAAADVTVTATASGKGPMGVDMGGTRTTRIKGNRMRMDMTRGDKQTAIIFDFDGQRMIALDENKHEATITSQARLQEALGKTSTGEIKASVTPTAETKTIAGFSCKVHNVSVEVPFSLGGLEMQMVMVVAGPACLSKDAPGYADYQRLFTTIADKGWILGDPRGAQGPAAAMAKGMASFQRTMVAAGMSLEQTVHMELKGEGPMAGMMGRMFKIDEGHVVTKIETGDLDAALFDVPAGYKVKQN